MHRLKKITAHEPFLMKQLEEVHHQNEGINQEKGRCRIRGNKAIIPREAMG